MVRGVAKGLPKDEGFIPGWLVQQLKGRQEAAPVSLTGAWAQGIQHDDADVDARDVCSTLSGHHPYKFTKQITRQLDYLQIIRDGTNKICTQKIKVHTTSAVHMKEHCEQILNRQTFPVRFPFSLVYAR